MQARESNVQANNYIKVSLWDHVAGMMNPPIHPSHRLPRQPNADGLFDDIVSSVRSWIFPFNSQNAESVGRAKQECRSFVGRLFHRYDIDPLMLNVTVYQGVRGLGLDEIGDLKEAPALAQLKNVPIRRRIFAWPSWIPRQEQIERRPQEAKVEDDNEWDAQIAGVI